MKRANTFTPMESDDTIPKVVTGSSKIDVEQELNQESSKTQKIGEGSEPAKESKDELKYWKIIRVGNHTEVYQIFEDMLKNFDMDDLVKIWNDDDTLWKLQRYMHDPLKWKLYDTYAIHHVSIERGRDIFMLVEKDYTRKQTKTKTVKSLEASSQHRWFNSEKLVDLNDNHMFRGGLLGIKGFYNFVLLVQLSTAMRRLSTVK
ncbi:hypothetical protein Tco_1415258, partial [Tanacetum coccineum]